MFTGIIQALGRVRSVSERGGDLRLCIDAPEIDPARLALGDSVAVAGVCLTVVERLAGGFAADVSRETLALTTVAQWRSGQALNLEPALRAGDPMGGHLVSGHVDGLAHLVSSRAEARSQRLCWRATPELLRFIATKGSVALDGVSLTVNEVSAAEFAVNLIPYTLQVTTLGQLAVGGQVNLEIDPIARYTARLLESGGAPAR
ncbi:MAG: riboflavin synthase [Steroidobacteraceae bacterium]